MTDPEAESRAEEATGSHSMHAASAPGATILAYAPTVGAPAWQGSDWMHALPDWEVSAGWDNAACRSGYAMPYTMPPMLPHLQQHRGPQQPPPPLHQPQMLPLPQQLQARGGVIFLCDPQTEDECLHRGLFGMPASQMQIVRQIAPEASLLYLFNVRLPCRPPPPPPPPPHPLP